MSKISSLSDAMLAAGVPAGFTLRESPGPVYAVVYAPGTTQQQQNTGTAVIAGFDASDAAQAARDLADRRAAAKALAQAVDVLSDALRAVLLTVLDELNVLRQRDRDRSTDVAAAASLADLKTRWAARSALADRTAAQAKQAVLDKIDSGTAD